MSASKSKLLSLAEFPTGILYHHDKGIYLHTTLMLTHFIPCAVICTIMICYDILYFI